MLEERCDLGGEFGRTPMNETQRQQAAGRDHHPHVFPSGWAGGGIKPGVTYGEPDELGYHVPKTRLHVHDLQATILHCLAEIDTKLTISVQAAISG